MVDRAIVALNELRAGNSRYVHNQMSSNIPNWEERAQLARGQSPFAAIVGCADSRVPVEVIFDQGPGRLFVVRAAGNVADTITIASVQYAVDVLNVPLIVVLGHEACGAVTAALLPGARKAYFTPEIRTLLGLIEPSVDESGDIYRSTVRNVDAQVARFRVNPMLAEAEASGQVRIMGAYFDIGNGSVNFR